MLQGANETGDYFWDVWREPNDQYGAVKTAPIFFGYAISRGEVSTSWPGVNRHPGKQVETLNLLPWMAASRAAME